MKTSIAVVCTFVPLLFAGCQTGPLKPSLAAPFSIDAEQPGIQDRIFLQQALAGGVEEIEISRLGIDRATDPNLRLLAQRIYDDHSHANQQLALVAYHEGIALDEVPPSPNLEVFRQSAGADFDRLYIRHILVDREGELMKFKAASRTARNLDVREFAARTTPTLQEHIRIARNIGRIAGYGEKITEPAGAEAVRESEPYYRANDGEPHQFEGLLPD